MRFQVLWALVHGRVCMLHRCVFTPTYTSVTHSLKVVHICVYPQISTPRPQRDFQSILPVRELPCALGILSTWPWGKKNTARILCCDRVLPRSHCKSNKSNRFLLLPTRCCTQGTTCANLDQCAVSDAKQKRRFRYREVLENRFT